MAIKSLSGGQVVSTQFSCDGAISARSGFLKTLTMMGASTVQCTEKIRSKRSGLNVNDHISHCTKSNF